MEYFIFILFLIQIDHIFIIFFHIIHISVIIN